MLVRNIINSRPAGPIITIGPDAKVAEAAQLLSENRIGAVVVSTGEDMPLGILSERDIVRDLGKRGSVCMEEQVRTLMTSPVVGCSPDMNVDEVLAEMTRGRFRHMPVIDDGKMIGFISIGDVVKARIDQLAFEKGALEDLVMGR